VSRLQKLAEQLAAKFSASLLQGPHFKEEPEVKIS
jgi:hypothetical protein